MVFLCSSPGKTVTGVQRGEHTVARSSRLVLFSHGALLSKLQDTDKIFRNNKRNIRADEAIRFAFHQLKNSGRIAVLDADWKFNETFSYCLIAAPFIPLCINHHPPSPCWHPLQPVSGLPSNVTHVGRGIPEQLPAAGEARSLCGWVKQRWHCHACSEKETRSSRKSRYGASIFN